MIIYKMTNNINGKIYVGKTIGTIEDRIKKHKESITTKGNNTLIKRALKKYGINNFSYEIIDRANNLEELRNKEYYWINYLNSGNISIGYNTIINETQEEELNNINKTKYTGITKIKDKYRMTFRYGTKLINKTFTNEIVAAEYYDKLCIYFRKDKFKNLLNFPEKQYNEKEIKQDIEFLILDKNKLIGINKRKNRWIANIKFKYKYIKTRGFKTKEAAAEAFDIMSLFLRGKEHEKINFPEKESNI